MSGAGWTCCNPMCRGSPQIDLSTNVCLHCGCRFGTDFQVITAADVEKNKKKSKK
jgi:hypothetical protein